MLHAVVELGGGDAGGLSYSSFFFILLRTPLFHSSKNAGERSVLRHFYEYKIVS